MIVCPFANGLAMLFNPMMLGDRYTLFMEGSNQVLLAARRRKKSKSSNYVIALDAHSVGRRSPTFCGKVRSNFVGTGFTIYDTGAKPGSRASESGELPLTPSHNDNMN